MKNTREPSVNNPGRFSRPSLVSWTVAVICGGGRGRVRQNGVASVSTDDDATARPFQPGSAFGRGRGRQSWRGCLKREPEVRRGLTQSNGTATNQVDDFVITAAVPAFNGVLIATTIADAQQTPSAIIPGGVFVTRVHTRQPNQ
jgi:hypothetical protein